MQRRHEFAGFTFEAGPDPQDPRRQLVLVFQNGLPFCDLHGAQMRKAFPAAAGPERVEQFCRRFATDHAFRTHTLVKHAFACC